MVIADGRRRAQDSAPPTDRMVVDAALLVVGALLAFLASLHLQRQERRASLRSHLYLELLPALASRAQHFHELADQDPNGPIWHPKKGDWPYTGEADGIFRHTMLLSGGDAQHGERIRALWASFAGSIHPDDGDLSSLILCSPTMANRTQAALGALEDYSRWIELRSAQLQGARRWWPLRPRAAVGPPPEG